MDPTTAKSHTLFGEHAGGWHADEWASSDDRVRGGKSQSYLTCAKSYAEFHGNLDIKTLGSAGFASQKTTALDTTWDLSNYDGIELIIGKADQKQYTFIIKDELLPANPENGREQSTISFEYNFNMSSARDQKHTTIFIPWNDLKATYRGKEKEDAPKLKTKEIKRMSVMMRSFFGAQEGEFSLSIISIAAANSGKRVSSGNFGEKHANDSNTNPGVLTWLFGKLWKL